ncbi:MAG: hypothetical protein CEN92_378 [Candidatus Berkelbacteria bacterium Licking1014_96]|uniref:Uncharacterized protein n=1 Tax=Candidatus Berkelbacteria bacterium Licking1014_96 TaxID=2017149 RepID=A0A554LD55_9BACT|nr:MAG: hypothetical protein CEN92_378 [Candidatus Berkelbacteria bacterium Licking1014_96]
MDSAAGGRARPTLNKIPRPDAPVGILDSAESGLGNFVCFCGKNTSLFLLLFPLALDIPRPNLQKPVR